MEKWLRLGEVIFAGAVALFTGVLIITSYFQYQAARRAAREAKRANELAHHALVDVQRAYVYEQGVSLTNATAATRMKGNPQPEMAQIIVPFGNTGNTPAQDFTHIETYCVTNSVPPALPLDLAFSYPSEKQWAVPTLLPAKVTDNGFISVPRSDVRDVEAFKAGLVVWGTIKYDDVFATPHVMQWCQTLIGRGLNVKTNETADIFGYCNRHNCEDDKCPKAWGQGSLDCRSQTLPHK